MHPSVPSDGNALFLASSTPLLPAVLVVLAVLVALVVPVVLVVLAVLVVLVVLDIKKSRDTLRYHGSTYYTPSLFFNHQKSFLRNPLPQIHQH